MATPDSRYSAASAAPPRAAFETVPAEFRRFTQPDAGSILLLRTHAAHLHPRVDILETYLSAEERERQARFIRPADRLRFGLFRGFLRQALGGLVQVEPAALRFVAEPGGKPMLDPAFHPGAPAFNLSHSGDALVIALAREGAVGADVEALDRRTDVLGVARHSFHPREYMWMAALEPDEQQRLFFRWWTAKEAVLKASGAGIGAGLARLDFSAWTNDACARIRDADARAWTVWHYGADGAAASVAVSFPLIEARVLATEAPGAASGELSTRSS